MLYTIGKLSWILCQIWCCCRWRTKVSKGIRKNKIDFTRTKTKEPAKILLAYQITGQRTSVRKTKVFFRVKIYSSVQPRIPISFPPKSELYNHPLWISYILIIFLNAIIMNSKKTSFQIVYTKRKILNPILWSFLPAFRKKLSFFTTIGNFVEWEWGAEIYL